MSTATAWSLTSTATIWPRASTDKEGVVTFGTPYTIACSFLSTDTSRRDDNGVEFVPRWRFITEADSIKRGDYVVKGDQTVISDPTTLEQGNTVRQVKEVDQTALGADEAPDFVIFTSD